MDTDISAVLPDTSEPFVAVKLTQFAEEIHDQLMVKPPVLVI
jgi:hypothetical protein